MSQHPSLRSSEKDKKQRSVLKRYERVKLLKDGGKWVDDDSVYGLPKVKIVRFKIKKEKAQAAEATEGATDATGAATPAPQAQTGKTPAKEASKAPGKEASKGAAGDSKK